MAGLVAGRKLYALRTVGYTPEISTWAFQIGPGYHDASNPITKTTVIAIGEGAHTRLEIIRGRHWQARGQPATALLVAAHEL